MYAGTTFTRISGNIIGAHQKIDRVARRHLEKLIPDVKFPEISDILHFEGSNGPDGIKRKSPSKNEPWHFIQPFDIDDTQLIDTISDHYHALVKAIRAANQVRASFEAAWLAHAMVDGLTPAHHYPYEEKLSELRNGESMDTRSTMKKRLLMSGETKTHAILNNWKMWGPKGLFSTHASFEFGVATLIAPLSFKDIESPDALIKDLTHESIADWYRSLAQNVAKLNLYDDFYKTGWTVKLSNKVKKQLAPTLINAVTAVWYSAYKEAIDK
ncbi:MAG TPA: hypothetical protein VIH90_07085 [Candidatus Saccharimonadales bacterium]